MRHLRSSPFTAPVVTRLVAGWAAGVAGAGEIAVVNPSFELPVQGECQFSATGMVGWTATCGNPSWGSWRPTPDCFYEGFSAGIPNGAQVGYVNCVNAPIQQVLAETVQAGQQYTLVTEVGKRSDCCAMIAYRIRLLGGAVVIAEDNDSLEPPTGGWATSVVSVTVPRGHAAVGAPLTIELALLEGGQGNFDHVRLLTGPYIPEGLEGDVDGDGSVNASDLALLLGAWGPCTACDACPSDLDGDCAVGASDLALVLGGWTG